MNPHTLVDERLAHRNVADDQAVLEFDSEEPGVRPAYPVRPVVPRGHVAPRRDAPLQAVHVPDTREVATARHAMPIPLDVRAGPRPIAALALVGGIGAAFLSGFVLGQRQASAPGPDVLGAAVVVGPPPLERLTADAEVVGMPALEALAVGSEAPIAPDIGQLVVRSTPSGAEVALDGVARGTTPLSLGRLRLGQRTLQVSLPGYDVRQRAVALSPDRPGRVVDVGLLPAGSMPLLTAGVAEGATGAVQVASNPAGAQLFIDDRLVGTVPLLMSGVDPGSHRVRLELEGFRSWSASVLVEPDQRFRIDQTLEPLSLAP